MLATLVEDVPTGGEPPRPGTEPAKPIDRPLTATCISLVDAVRALLH